LIKNFLTRLEVITAEELEEKTIFEDPELAKEVN